MECTLPKALHSEGHQDSMGICLFFVLSDRLSETDLQIMLLDDVILSVDVGHRKRLAKLLVDEFNNRQIILTTHDNVWNEQLQTERFAAGPNIIELQRWTIDTGPIFREIQPIWDSITDDLELNRVDSVGFRLRRWAESFAKTLCHNFRAPVPFRLDGKYSLSDVLDPARSSFKKYLNKALNRAQRRNDTALTDMLKSFQIKTAQAYEAIDKEYWILNFTSHDNQAGKLTSEEILDAVTAFQEFCDLFHCPKCCCLMELSGERDVITCRCGHISWKV